MRSRSNCVITMFAVAALLSATTARAGGLARPNPFSARAYGWGGAFVAIADDPTALHFNPAGLTQLEKNSFLFGATLLAAPRELITDVNGVSETQSTTKNFKQIPVLGYAHRLSANGIPSRLTLGIGLWNTYGGSSQYPKGNPTVAVIDKSTALLLEVVPGLAYEVNEFLSLGVALRLGVGITITEVTQRPKDAEFSAVGVGAGATFGIMVRPTSNLQFGVSYRTPLSANVSGSGTVFNSDPGMDTAITVNHVQKWPQALLAGVAFRPFPRLRLSAQIDWTDWSVVDELVFEVLPDPALPVVTDFKDTIALHAGAEFAVSNSLVVRAGYTADGNAIPDRTMQRNYLGGPHQAVAAGIGIEISKHWRIDAAVEYLFGKTRLVDDNLQQFQDQGGGLWLDRANMTPGEYKAKLMTFELDAQYSF